MAIAAILEARSRLCVVLCISSVFVARCLCLLLLLCLCLSSVWPCISQSYSVVPWWCRNKLVRDRLLDFLFFFFVFFRFSCFPLCSRRLGSCCDPNWCFVWKSTNCSEPFRVRISEFGVFFPWGLLVGWGAGSGAGGGGRRGCVFATLFVGVVVMGITNVQHVSKAAAEGLTAKFSDLCDPQELLKQQSQQQQRRTRMSQLASKSRQATKTFRQIRLREKTLDEVLTYYLSLSYPRRTVVFSDPSLKSLSVCSKDCGLMVIGVCQVKFSSTAEEAFVMSLIPLRTESTLIKLRRSQSLKMPRAITPTPAKSYYSAGVTKKVILKSSSSSS